ncbi:hypothetical protein F4818DRAFT_443959 [Hypoxylon cercidicola]|nr:hypothetical protein F4818DRAFT_443959 [Hypoxylon cercidicola]
MARLIDTLPEPQVIREKKVIVLSRSRGKPYGKAEFDKWLADYDSVIEIPQFFVKEFIEFYPGPLLKTIRSFPFLVARRVDTFIDVFCFLHFVLDDVWFHGKGPDNGMEDAKRDVLAGNEMAKTLILKERLLVAKLEDGFGWEQICPFLGHDIPSMPYPKGNAPAGFQELGKQVLRPGLMKAAALAVSVILVPIVGIGAWYSFRDR